MKEDLQAWETNAEFWDNYMGDESNFSHRDLVRPKTDEFLKFNADDVVLDIACGNGNYSEWMAAKGVSVVAFDFSERMIELAKARRTLYADKIKFCVCDATNYKEIKALEMLGSPFTKAVANMAIMDISEKEPIICVQRMRKNVML